jgi:hypothetical protein
VLVTQAALTLRDISPRHGMVDQDMEYRLEVGSTGSAPATNVELKDVLSAATENLLEVNAGTLYEIRVVNQGSGPSSNVRIVAVASEGLILVNAEGPAVSHVQGQQVLFDPVPQLTPRGELVFRVHAKGRRPGDGRFQIQLTSDQLPRPVVKEESTRVYGD